MSTCLCCKNERKFSPRSVCEKCFDLHFEKKVKWCSECTDVLDWSKFGFHKASLFQLNSKCKECCRIISKTRLSNVPDAFFQTLNSSCKRGAKSRKGDAKIYDIKWTDIKDLYITQHGLCYYTGMKMTVFSNLNLKTSVERINTKLGYILSNVVLCCIEFNGSCQWSPEKISEMIMLVENQDDIQNLSEIVEISKRQIKYNIISIPIETSTVNGIIYHSCNKCYKILPKDKFNKAFNKGCISCQSNTRSLYITTLRGRLMNILSHARRNTKIRKNGKHADNRNHTIDIEFKDLVDIYERQKGFNSYSYL